MTGRNELCPCGSGKIYKKCCINKEKPSTVIGNPVEEEAVLGELLKGSKQFLFFYQFEMSKIKASVNWIHDSSMPETNRYEAIKTKSGAFYIRLKTIPAILKEATNIAHELQHFIIETEGFPSTVSNITESDKINLSLTLNSMLHDPLVDSRLEKYGFDLWTNYYQETDQATVHLGFAPYPPSNHLQNVNWIFIYSSFILDWELRNKTAGSPSKFQLWFDSHFSSVAAEGKELLTLVQKVGFDNPENMNILLSEIIKKYKLRWLTIVKPSTYD